MKLTFNLSRKARRAVRRTLRKGKLVRARLIARATDAAGNSRTAALRIKSKRLTTDRPS